MREISASEWLHGTRREENLVVREVERIQALLNCLSDRRRFLTAKSGAPPLTSPKVLNFSFCQLQRKFLGKEPQTPQIWWIYSSLEKSAENRLSHLFGAGWGPLCQQCWWRAHKHLPENPTKSLQIRCARKIRGMSETPSTTTFGKVLQYISSLYRSSFSTPELWGRGDTDQILHLYRELPPTFGSQYATTSLSQCRPRFKSIAHLQNSPHPPPKKKTNLMQKISSSYA